MEGDNRSVLQELVLPEMPPPSQEQMTPGEVGLGVDSNPPPTTQSHPDLGQVAESDLQPALQSGQALRPLSRCYPTYAENLRLPDSRLDLRYKINCVRHEQGIF